MMISKEVNIARVQTMADGSIRIVIDLLNGNKDDFSTAYELMAQDTTMILTRTENLRSDVGTEGDMEGVEELPNPESEV